MPTFITILTTLGLVSQVPAIVLWAVLIADSLQSLQKGVHASNAGRDLVIPFVIIALVGGLMTFGTGAWSLKSEVGRAAGWGWVRWSSVLVSVIWVVGLVMSG